MLWRIRRSPWRIAVQGLALAGMILQPVPMARSYWTDSNADGVKEWVADPDPAVDPGWFEADSDGDLMSNGAEVVYEGAGVSVQQLDKGIPLAEQNAHWGTGSGDMNTKEKECFERARP